MVTVSANKMGHLVGVSMSEFQQMSLTNVVGNSMPFSIMVSKVF